MSSRETRQLRDRETVARLRSASGGGLSGYGESVNEMDVIICKIAKRDYGCGKKHERMQGETGQA